MVLGINLKQEQEKDLFVQNDVKKKITTSPPARRESSPTKSNKRLTPRETKASVLRKQAQLKKAASLEEKVSCVLCNEIISVRRTNNQNFHGTLPRNNTELHIQLYLFQKNDKKSPADHCKVVTEDSSEEEYSESECQAEQVPSMPLELNETVE